MTSELAGVGGEGEQGKEKPKAGNLGELVGKAFCCSGNFLQDLVTTPRGQSTSGLMYYTTKYLTIYKVAFTMW